MFTEIDFTLRVLKKLSHIMKFLVLKYPNFHNLEDEYEIAATYESLCSFAFV